MEEERWFEFRLMSYEERSVNLQNLVLISLINGAGGYEEKTIKKDEF
jgi:hypothetical protein